MFKNNFVQNKKLQAHYIKKVLEQKKILQNNLKKNIPFKFNIKENYNSIIPLHVYTCWHTKDLPPKMKENYNFLAKQNYELKFHLYDENECQEFIKNNFEEDVLNAYNSLIPASYKSDLWRFCVLYINGGIYYDIKYRCENGFKFIALTEKEHFPADVAMSDYSIEENEAAFTGFLISLPKNEKLLKAINKIVENVKNKYYGTSPYHPTGPYLLGECFDYEEKKNSIVKRYIGNQGDGVSIGGIIILNTYPEYRDEQSKCSIHYSEYWKNKNIYYD
jgi:mannosyltransferase OCH1-like enzyme